MAADWAVAGGTALLALATFALAWTARRQSKVAAEHVVAIQRPLVSPVVTPEWEGVHQSRITLKKSGLGARVQHRRRALLDGRRGYSTPASRPQP